MASSITVGVPTRLLLPAALLVAVATVALFWPALRFGYVQFDDPTYVANNPFVLHGLTAKGLGWAFGAMHEDYWLPVLWVSYMVDVELFGATPWAFHLGNVLLHACNAALVFWLFARWTRCLWPALLAAALFAWHPLRVESVAWIAERKDVLSGFFFLLGLAAYGAFVRKPSRWREASVAGCLALGLMAKPMLVTFPFVLLLLDVWPLRRVDGFRKLMNREGLPLYWEKRWLWLTALLFAGLTFVTQRAGGTVKSLNEISFLERVAAAPTLVVFYLKQTLWPLSLHTIYDVIRPTATSALGAAALLASITLAVLVAARRSRSWLVGWLWFAGMLMPVIGFIRVGTVQAADRFTYLPSIGLAIMTAWGLAWLGTGGRARRGVSVGLAASALFGLCVLTRGQLPVWQDTYAMFLDAVEGAPNHPLALNNAAWMVATEPDARRPREVAIAWALRANGLAPEPDPTYLDTLAAAYAANGRMAEAVATAEEALALARALGRARQVQDMARRLDAYRKSRAVIPQP